MFHMNNVIGGIKDSVLGRFVNNSKASSSKVKGSSFDAEQNL